MRILPFLIAVGILCAPHALRSAEVIGIEMAVEETPESVSSAQDDNENLCHEFSGQRTSLEAIPSRLAPFLLVQERADFLDANAAEATPHS